ncbi:hypothetical protein LWF01_07565 [Saxibacter everestensis]|uniref:SHOCT domain-containing protein n=1 Tax=Saxibacter everestensis TaxID=2909229 RepID=A0ABY8QX53_9MICO|nr:hypothetical protein LWF01_07565 [Brevibacteriaceae bacterium ZFBP1038]
MFTAQHLSPLTTAVAEAGRNYHQYGPPWPFPIFGLIFLAVLITFLVLGWNRLRNQGRTSARDVLADRFARGDINGEEYHQRLSELKRK